VPHMVQGLWRRVPEPGADRDATLHRAAFASAVAGSSVALLIGSDNRAAGRTTYTDAVERDLPFAVTVASHLLAVDIDDDPTAADTIADAAAAARVPALVCASGQPGRFHVWLVVGQLDSQLDHDLRMTLRPHGDVRARGAFIRPPLGRHRLTVELEGRALPARSRPLQPLDTALEILTGPPADQTAVRDLVETLGGPPAVADRPAGRLQRRSLPQRTRQLLAQPLPPRGQRSEQVARIALLAARSGLRPDEWFDLVSNTWVEAYAATKQADRWRWLAREYDRACATVAAGGADSATARHARHLRAHLLDATGTPTRRRWWRQSGLAMVDAILETVAATGRTSVDIPVRWLAEQTNTSRSAAHRAVVRLVAAGVLVPDGQPAQDQAVVYRVALGPLGAWLECPTSPRDEGDGSPEPVCEARTADVWVYESPVGRCAWVVWLALRRRRSPTDVLPATLQLLTGRWVATLLRRLRALRLDATRLEGTTDRLAVAARAAGVDGRLEALRDRHLQERGQVSVAALRTAMWQRASGE
jgi:hypothetical protein